MAPTIPPSQSLSNPTFPFIRSHSSNPLHLYGFLLLIVSFSVTGLMEPLSWGIDTSPSTSPPSPGSSCNPILEGGGLEGWPGDTVAIQTTQPAQETGMREQKSQPDEGGKREGVEVPSQPETQQLQIAEAREMAGFLFGSSEQLGPNLLDDPRRPHFLPKLLETTRTILENISLASQPESETKGDSNRRINLHREEFALLASSILEIIDQLYTITTPEADGISLGSGSSQIHFPSRGDRMLTRLVDMKSFWTESQILQAIQTHLENLPILRRFLIGDNPSYRMEILGILSNLLEIHKGIQQRQDVLEHSPHSYKFFWSWFESPIINFREYRAIRGEKLDLRNSLLEVRKQMKNFLRGKDVIEVPLLAKILYNTKLQMAGQ